MTPDEYACSIPLDSKCHALLDLPFETVIFIEFDYFWCLYCKKNKVEKYLPFISWKDNYMKYQYYKELRGFEIRLSFLKLWRKFNFQIRLSFIIYQKRTEDLTKSTFLIFYGPTRRRNLIQSHHLSLQTQNSKENLISTMDNRNQRPNSLSLNQNSVRTDPTTHAHQQYYERMHLETNQPRQSGFVSSTSWTDGDSSYYKNQTINSPTYSGNGRVQDNNVSSSSSKR